MRTSPLLEKIPNLVHGFTTKLDAPEIQEQVRASTSNVKQVHKDGLHWIQFFEKAKVEADAIGTTEKNLPIGIYTADCAPLLMASINKNGEAFTIMAVHAGWRSTALQIASKALRSLVSHSEKNLDHVCISIGPTISKKAFEVGPEVISAFPNGEKDGVAEFLRMEDSRPKHLFHLSGENARQVKETAQQIGISLKVEDLGDCSFFQENLYHSYRRDREKAGRILSYLAIR